MNHKQRLFQIKAPKASVTKTHYPIKAFLQPPVEADEQFNNLNPDCPSPIWVKRLYMNTCSLIP